MYGDAADPAATAAGFLANSLTVTCAVHLDRIHLARLAHQLSLQAQTK